MTQGCDNISVAELYINGLVYSRRNYYWQHMISCAGCQNCACNDWDSAHLAPNGWDNIMHLEWVDLPAGVNTISVRGFRFGIGGVQSALELAVWCRECPPVTTNVICIPASVIAELGLCEFERLAALHGTMVGCVQVSQPCAKAPDIYQYGNYCIMSCEGTCHIQPGDIASEENPLGGQPMNQITLEYDCPIRVQIGWHTAFLQNFFISCNEACPDCFCED